MPFPMSNIPFFKHRKMCRPPVTVVPEEPDPTDIISKPLPKGYQPTEPGWFIVDCVYGCVPAEVKWSYFKRRLLVRVFNSSYDQPIKGYRFVARFYPDRM